MRGGGSVMGKLETYLDFISSFAQDTTVASHKSTLVTFGQSHEEASITVDNIAEYIVETTSNKQHDTVNGEVPTFANYLAYLNRTSPAIVETEIRTAVSNRLNTGNTPRQPHRSITKSQLGDTHSQAVELLAQYLGKTDFGTRRHALVQLILETTIHPTLIPEINREDFHKDSRRIELPISSMYVLGRQDDVRHIAQLPQETTVAIETYLDTDRTAGEDALFTTVYGRISTDTIRRAIQAGFKSAIQAASAQPDRYSVHPDEIPDTVDSLSPKTIRHYALNQHQ